MKSPFYQLSAARQAQKLQQLATTYLPEWGIVDAELTLLKMRENAVFEVNTKTGQRYALRVHRAAYHCAAELKSELQWMQALEQSGVEVPQLIPTLSGELFLSCGSPEYGGNRQLDLFEWVAGKHLGAGEGNEQSLASLQQNYRDLGRIAARIHLQALNWQVPEGFQRHAWNREGLVGEQPLWGRFWELEALSKAESELMLQVRDRLRQDLLAYSQLAESKTMYSLIHADLVQENVLVEGERLRLIDFDDAGFGWHLFELATTLYFSKGETHYQALEQALLEGYCSIRPLSEQQLNCLPLFLLARGTTYLGWAQTRGDSTEAQGLAPMFIDQVCMVAQEYLAS